MAESNLNQETYLVEDKEERMRLRRKRIEARQKNPNDENQESNESSAERQRKLISQRRKAAGLERLQDEKEENTSFIEQYAAAKLEADAARKTEEMNARQERLQQIKQEAVSSEEKGKDIIQGWKGLDKYYLPTELAQAMEEQKQHCRELSESKDEVIQMLEAKFKDEDKEYVNMIKTQLADVNAQLAKMSERYLSLRESYEEELEGIEGAFLREREAMLQQNRNDIHTIFEKRKSLEMSYIERKQGTEEKFRKEIEQMRQRDGEEYKRIKSKLQQDIRTLKQQFAEMKLTYQLNAEKLEYNYRVLTERDMENQKTLSQQKKKLQRLKESLAQVKQTYAATDSKERQRNTELTTEYKRLTKQYKELQQKFKLLQVNDRRKYKEVWKMHEDEVADMVSQLLQGDKLIHERILKWKWRPPSEALFEGSPSDEARERKIQREDRPKEIDDDKTSQVTFTEDVCRVVDMIADEAGFLIEQHIQDKISSVGPAEAHQIRREVVLRILQVKNDEDAGRLVRHFALSTFSSGADQKKSIENVDMHLISPENVVKATRDFLEDHRGENTTISSLLQNNLDSPFEVDSQQSGARSKAQDLRDGQSTFWQRMASVTPEHSSRAMTALEKGLTKYLGILESRANMMEEVESLRRSNDKLKTQLEGSRRSAQAEALLITPDAIPRQR